MSRSYLTRPSSRASFEPFPRVRIRRCGLLPRTWEQLEAATYASHQRVENRQVQGRAPSWTRRHGSGLRSLRHVASSSCRHQNTPRARARRRGLQATLRARGPSRGKVAASEHRDHPRTGEFRQRGKALHRHGISQGLRPLFRYPRRRVDSVGRIARCRFSALPGARLRAPTRGHSSGCETVQRSLPRRRSREDHGLRHCPHGRHASNYSERRADGNDALHVAGASARTASRWPLGRLLRRLHLVRNASAPRTFWRRRRERCALQNRVGGAPADPGLSSRAPRTGSGHLGARSRQENIRSLRECRGDESGARHRPRNCAQELSAADARVSERACESRGAEAKGRVEPSPSARREIVGGPARFGSSGAHPTRGSPRAGPDGDRPAAHS